jgi:[ribosomal protein S5]-alanine N-acetyltransferase
MNTRNTERLILRPFEETDIDTFRRLHSDPGMTAKMHRGSLNAGEARELFAGYRQAFSTDGFGMRAVCWRESGEMIGECGLWWRETAGGYTVRYMLARNWWGKGLTGEAAGATVSDAFGTINLDTLYAVAMDGNEHSVRALHSLGMTKIEDNHRGITGFGRYRLTRATFRDVLADH